MERWNTSFVVVSKSDTLNAGQKRAWRRSTAISSKTTSGESEDRTATKAFRKRGFSLA